MHRIKITIIIVFAMLITSCKSTKIVSSWSQPKKEVKVSNLKKVLVVALFNNETTRRRAEDQMIEYLKGKGVVSYNYLDDNFNKNNEEAIQRLIKKDGFDAVITMRLIDVEKDQVYISNNQTIGQSSYYRNFGGYYNRNYPFYSDRGYYANTKIYNVETVVFSILQDKIIWSGLTKSTNPDGVAKMTEEVANVVFKKMVKQGFVKK